jgi:hypothetical protein
MGRSGSIRVVVLGIDEGDCSPYSVLLLTYTQYVYLTSLTGYSHRPSNELHPL